MKKYRSFQISWILFGFLIPFLGWLTYLYIYQIGNNPLSSTSYFIFLAVFLIIFLLFYGLSLSMNGEVLKITFGIGLINIKIKLANIISVKIVRNPWYYGWGIRIIPTGTLYNVTGFDAVELVIKNKDRVIRIGSPEVNKLKLELEKRIAGKAKI